jgi:hypothetical protein
LRTRPAFAWLEALAAQDLTLKQGQKTAHIKLARLKSTQQGAAMLLMAFVMAMLAMFVLFKMLNKTSLQTIQQEKTMQNLNRAKNDILAMAVNNPDDDQMGLVYPEHIGQFPFPDRSDDGDYDGTSDCNSPTSVFQYAFLIGQLPVSGRNNPCIQPQKKMSPQLTDAYGNRLWYAVSRNLVHKYESPENDPVINPSLISAPTYPWLKVLDRNGAVLSDRVAVVILAPGNAMGGQNRAGAAAANQFLDSISISGTPYSNSDYDTPDEDFILGEDTRYMSDSNPLVGRPYLFNDQLVYITIDELMSALNKRAAQEAGWLVNSYRTKNGYFPNAADLSVLTITSNQYVAGASQQGLLPLDVTDAGCGCASDTSCHCGFNPISSVTMYRDSGTWDSAQDAGSCVSTIAASGKECTCTGAGSCTRFARTFTCDATGQCDSAGFTATPSNKITYKLPAYADFYNPQNGCVMAGDELECNNAGSFEVGLKEPVWFSTNRWQQYLYYRWSSASDLSAGTQAGLSAIMVAVGDVTTAETAVSQVRPSNSLQDYLDSVENTDADAQFESVLKKRSNAYNDEVFIISP